METMRRPCAALAPLRLPADPASVPAARHYVLAGLSDFRALHQPALNHPSGIDDQVLDAAALVVSELVTNGILHARTDLEVTLLVEAGVVRIEVADGTSTLPVPKARSEHSGTGRGLTMIDAVASEWGVRIVPEGGKTVWAELALEPARHR